MSAGKYAIIFVVICIPACLSFMFFKSSSSSLDKALEAKKNMEEGKPVAIDGDDRLSGAIKTMEGYSNTIMDHTDGVVETSSKRKAVRSSSSDKSSTPAKKEVKVKTDPFSFRIYLREFNIFGTSESKDPFERMGKDFDDEENPFDKPFPSLRR